MQFHIFQIFTLSLYVVLVEKFGYIKPEDVADTDTLVLAHVLFRHGNRTANGPEELYPNDPYINETYFPFGLGQLTNAGKMKEYSLGKALRRRYNDFLGPYYYPEIVEGWSTDYNRTKASLEFVFAGLFPPYQEEVWNEELPWQPVPYNYLPKSQDKVLLGVLCPYYLKLYNEHIQSGQHRRLVSQYRNIFEYLSNHTGLHITTFLDVYNLYFGLSTELEWGFSLPEWTKKVWPKTIIDLTVQEYFASTANKEMHQMASGYFLEKIISDTKAKMENERSGRKMYLYSAHESNVAELLVTLGIFDPVHVPNYGSYIVLEVHKIDDKYGIKIFYENYDGDRPKLMKLPACETFCELNKFITMIEEYLPSDEDLCNRMT